MEIYINLKVSTSSGKEDLNFLQHFMRKSFIEKFFLFFAFFFEKKKFKFIS